LYWLSLLGTMSSVRLFISGHSMSASLSIQCLHRHFIKLLCTFLLRWMLLSSLILSTSLQLRCILPGPNLNKTIFLGNDLLTIVLCFRFLIELNSTLMLLIARILELISWFGGINRRLRLIFCLDILILFLTK
jgi:hypothetical protein